MQSQGIELAYLAGVDAQGPGDGHLVQPGCLGVARNDAEVFTELFCRSQSRSVASCSRLYPELSKNGYLYPFLDKGR